ARGTAKLWKDRWSLVDFGTGFVRLALRTKTPIVPFGFIGGGDAIPTVANLYKIGRLAGVPYVPVTPWLLPLPRPVKLEIQSGAPKGIELHAADIRKRAAEEVFRRRKPQAVVHMATVTALVAGTEERYRINLGGTRAVFEHCANYGVEQMVFVGRHTYYGAGPDAPLYHTENEPPQELGAYSELSDLVAADLYAANALWRLPKLST